MQNGNAVSKTHNWGVKWTPEEDQRLIQGIELYGESDWKKVSDIVATRAPGAVCMLCVLVVHQISAPSNLIFRASIIVMYEHSEVHSEMGEGATSGLG